MNSRQDPEPVGGMALTAAKADPDGRLADNIAYFARALRKAGLKLGPSATLDAIAAVVIGGTSLSGGRGTILGTIVGALIISVLANGLRILSVAQEWQTVVTGLIIILAVYTDMLRRRGV